LRFQAQQTQRLDPHALLKMLSLLSVRLTGTGENQADAAMPIAFGGLLSCTAILMFNMLNIFNK
jgi:hypothetical protein